MADATVPRPRPDEALADPDERASRTSNAAASGRRWLILVIWAALALLLLLFLSLGSIRIGAGNWIGRRMTVPRIWDRFLDYLTDQGASQPVIAVVIGAAIIAVVGSIGLVWVAFGVHDDRPSPGDLPAP